MNNFRTHLNDESGAELPEWIALIAIVLVLLLAAAAVFAPAGGEIATGITDGGQSWAAKWTGGQGGGSNGAADGSAAGPNSGNPQLVNNGSQGSTSAPATDGPVAEGSADKETGALDQVGGFFVGVWDGAVNTVTGVVVLGRDGLVALPGTGHIAEWLFPGIREETFARYDQMWEAVKGDPLGALYAMVEPMVSAWEDGEHGRAIGMGVFEIGMIFVPGDEVGKIGKIAAIDRVLPDELIRVLARIEQATPEELGALLRRAEQLTPDELAAARRRLDDLSPAELARAQMDDVMLRRLGLACSFTPNTAVLTESGAKPIAALARGERVLAWNEQTQATGLYPILAVLVHIDPTVMQITINGETLTTTPEHPFFTQSHGWVPAEKLTVGDQLRNASGAYSPIADIQVAHLPQPMYNLHVAVAHTFFVGAGEWLVHNTCLRDPNTIRFTQDSIRGTFKDGSSVDDLVAKLRSGELTAENVPPIRIFERDGKIYSLDNRRLHAFREAGIPIRTVQAKPDDVLAEAWKFTTNNDGASIRVRGR